METCFNYDSTPVCVCLCVLSPPRSTGKERDQESGNDYFGARYYGSSMGRFMSPDWSAEAEPVPYSKLDNPQSLNLYAYVDNNPLATVDADGHIGNFPGADTPDLGSTESLLNGNDPAVEAQDQQAQQQNSEQSWWHRLKQSFDQPDSLQNHSQAPMESRGRGGPKKGERRGTGKPGRNGRSR